MQSWGIGDLYEKNRKTNRFPTKSAVIGMLAAALGWDRDHDLNSLDGLHMSVRIDSPGSLHYDFQIIKKQIIKKPSDVKLSHRWYLSDAVFLVALQSEDLDLLDRLSNALLHPAFNIFAGRKAFPLNPDLVQGVVRGKTSMDLLSQLEWMGRGVEPGHLEVVRDAFPEDQDVSSIHDVPINFRLDHRDWASRSIVREWISLNENEADENEANENEVVDRAVIEEYPDWLDEDEESSTGSSTNGLDFMAGKDVFR